MYYWLNIFRVFLCFGLLDLKVAVVVHSCTCTIFVLASQFCLFYIFRRTLRISWIFLVSRPLERTGSVTVLFTPKSASASMSSFDVLMSRLFTNGVSCFKSSLRTFFSKKQKLLVSPKQVATTLMLKSIEGGAYLRTKVFCVDCSWLS